MTEQSRAECGHRQRAPFALLIPFSSSTPFHPHKRLGCTHARESPVSAEQLGCAFRARATRFRLWTKHTNHSPNDAPEVPAFAPRAGASQNGGEIAATAGFLNRLKAT